MKTKLFSLALAMVIAVSVSAQDYKSSVGIRFAAGPYDTFGATFKTFMSESAALQFDLGVNPTTAGLGIFGVGYNITRVALAGAYQHHFPIANVEGLKWYVGGGAVVGNSFSDWDESKGVIAGLFAVGGADYKLKSAPFAFSAEFRPTGHIVKPDWGVSGFRANAGVTARYVF